MRGCCPQWRFYIELLHSFSIINIFNIFILFIYLNKSHWYKQGWRIKDIMMDKSTYRVQGAIRKCNWSPPYSLIVHIKDTINFHFYFRVTNLLSGTQLLFLLPLSMGVVFFKGPLLGGNWFQYEINKHRSVSLTEINGDFQF